LQLSNGFIQQNSLKTPPVVIGNYVFDGICQDLFFIENKKLLKGAVSLHNGDCSIDETRFPDMDIPFCNLSIDYDKETINARPYQRNDWNDSLEYYRSSMNNCSLLFPSSALLMIERIRQFGNGMLLLSADRGTNDLSLLQEYTTPSFAFHGSFSLPVNYHTIGQSFVHNNGVVWYNPQRNSGLAMICAADIPGLALRETGVAAHEHVEEFNIDSFFLVKKTIEMVNTNLDYDKMISFLSLSKWDAKVFALFYDVCKNRLPDENIRIRNEWAGVIRKVWERYLPIGEQQDFAFELASIAAKMNFWKLAAFLYEESLQYNGDHEVTHFNCAIAYCQLAWYSKALVHYSKAIDINPEDERYFSKRDILVQLCTSSVNRGLSERMSASEDKQDAICITLLGLHFAKTLYTLQQNNEIRKLTRLKALNSIKETKIWIKEQLDRNNKITFAVVHPEHGLIGVVALEFSGKGALFYYWIGEEYQNRGYGTEALRLLIQYAQNRGIEYLYSSVFVSNSRSLQVLKSLEFSKVESVSDYDGEKLEYYYRPVITMHITDDVEQRRILDNLLENISSKTVNHS
ncbi:MAG TPA: GNAT family N-acetyltransferase, partial [Chitinispirillaceae bacterium]|nr:GNAT family N-acetyltransferase [Chitinispirillaceae bacterium]